MGRYRAIMFEIWPNAAQTQHGKQSYASFQALINCSPPGLSRRNLAAMTAFSALEDFSAFLWSKATFLLRARRRRSSLCRSVPAIILRFSRFNWG
jgi:hypothetical protein